MVHVYVMIIMQFLTHTIKKKIQKQKKKKKRSRSSMHDLCYVISSFSEIMPKITGALNFNLSCLNFTMQPGIVTAICKGNIRTIEIYKRFWGSTEAVANKVQGDQLQGPAKNSMLTPSREHILFCICFVQYIII